MVGQKINFLDAQRANELCEGMGAFRGIVPAWDDRPTDDNGFAR